MTSRRALVTGAEGFVGQALCAHLTAQGWDVRGSALRDLPDAGGSYFQCDITDRVEVERLMVWAAGATHVFHLAALTFVPDSLQDPALAMTANLIGTIHLTSSLKTHLPNARLIYVGSADAYGVPQSLPVTEDHPLRPDNPYSISKAAADEFCGYLHKASRADIVRMRPFNHSGAGQAERFVLSNFARQIAAIEAGKAEPVLRVGNLAAARDFSHVNDVVRAYELAALHGTAGEVYNVCSGRSRVIQDALDILLSLSTTPIRVEVDAARLRPVDVKDVHGSHAKLTAQTGWEPVLTFESLLADLLAYWRPRV